MDKRNYWTGLVDVTSEELPKGAIGAIYRVLTYANDYEMFAEKVINLLANSGDTVLVIEEHMRLSDFLKEGLHENHEIYEMLETADKNKENVVCGDVEFYGYDDA